MPFLANYLPDFRFEVSKRYFLSGTILSAALANESALSFPWIPIWLEIQQKITFLLWFMDLSLFRSLTMKGLSNLGFLRDCRIEIESEWMMNFSLSFLETSFSAKFIAEIFSEGIFSRFSCGELLHIWFHCCLWSHPWKLGYRRYSFKRGVCLAVQSAIYPLLVYEYVMWLCFKVIWVSEKSWVSFIFLEFSI